MLYTPERGQGRHNAGMDTEPQPEPEPVAAKASPPCPFDTVPIWAHFRYMRQT